MPEPTAQRPAPEPDPLDDPVLVKLLGLADRMLRRADELRAVVAGLTSETIWRTHYTAGVRDGLLAFRDAHHRRQTRPQAAASPIPLFTGQRPLLLPLARANPAPQDADPSLCVCGAPWATGDAQGCPEYRALTNAINYVRPTVPRWRLGEVAI